MLPLDPELLNSLVSDRLIVRERELETVLTAYGAERVTPSPLSARLMTALLAVEQLGPDVRITISQQAAAASQGRSRLKTGIRYHVDHVLLALLLEGDGTALVALGEQIAVNLPSFADMMMARARVLGMQQTRYDLIGASDTLPLEEQGPLNIAGYGSLEDLSRLIGAIRGEKRLAAMLRLRDETWYDSDGRSYYFRNQLSYAWTFVDGIEGGLLADHGLGREVILILNSRLQNFSYLLYIGSNAEETAGRAGERVILADINRLVQFVQNHFERTIIARRGEIYREEYDYFGETLDLQFLNTRNYVHPIGDRAVVDTRLVLPDTPLKLPLYSNHAIAELLHPQRRLDPARPLGRTATSTRETT